MNTTQIQAATTDELGARLREIKMATDMFRAEVADITEVIRERMATLNTLVTDANDFGF